MTLKYFPLGVPISSSFSLRADIAVDASNVPSTASLAESTLHPVGPSGSKYKVIYSTTDAT